MISLYDRVYVSCAGKHGRVSEIIQTGIVGIVKYRVVFDDDDTGIYGAAFVQPAPVPRGRAVLRLAAVDGVRLA